MGTAPLDSNLSTMSTALASPSSDAGLEKAGTPLCDGSSASTTPLAWTASLSTEAAGPSAGCANQHVVDSSS